MNGSTMVERDVELRALHAAANEAAASNCRLVLITGEAGIGKTTLWSTFVDDLPGHWTIEFVGGHHTDRSFAAPFQHLAGALPGEGEAARELAGAVAEACTHRAVDGPVLLVVEDLHYIDPVAVAALPHLLNALRRAPVLVLATYRAGSHEAGTAHSGAVADLLRHARASQLPLRPLTEDGVRSLLRLAAHTPPPGAPTQGSNVTVETRAAGLFARTDGNPFFVDALIRSGDPDDAQIPWTVAEAVLSLVDSLPADA